MINEWSTDMRNLLLLLLAIIGGILGHINREVSLGRKLVVLRTLFAGIAAGFAGLLLLLLCSVLSLSAEVTAITIGTLSWLGTDVTLRLLEKYVYKTLGISHGFSSPGQPLTEQSAVHRLSDVCERKGAEPTTDTTTSGSADSDSTSR